LRDPEAYDRLGEEEEDDYEEAESFTQDQSTAPETEAKLEQDKTDPGQPIARLALAPRFESGSPWLTGKDG
jgi:hypothetical protein